MTRAPRLELAGGIHHVYARGAAKQPIFVDDLDRNRYLSLLARTTRRMSWHCLAYCLMGNHVHVLVETPEPNLGRGMHLVHGGYAQAFNRRHTKAGHLFGARFGSNHVATDAQLWVTVSYIARNPVEAGLCRTPESWPWSSHASVLTRAFPSWLDAPRLLSYFGQVGGDPHRRYLEFIAAEPKGAWPL
jgi:REP element-mobilizing transposase RayT